MESGIVIAPSPPRLRAGRGLVRSRDESLAARVRDGDESAFAEIHRRYHANLYRYCRSIVRHEQDAQDALQATLISAYRALRDGRRDAPLRPWLFRIAHNEAVSVLRRRRPDAELSEALPDHGGVEEAADVRERMRSLVADLGSLPERQRSALVMRELNGLSHEDIGAALSTTPAAAKQTIFEARQALADLEAGRAMSCEDICRVISDGDRRALRGRRVRAHLRACGSCATFEEAIRRRRSDLRALAPALPPGAGALVLSRVLGSAGRAGSGGSSSVAAAAGKTLTGSMLSKAVVAGVVISGGVAGVAHVVTHPGPSHRILPAAAQGDGAHRAPATAPGGSAGATALDRVLRHGQIAPGQPVAASVAAAGRSARPARAAGSAAGDRPGHRGAGRGHGSGRTGGSGANVAGSSAGRSGRAGHAGHSGRGGAGATAAHTGSAGHAWAGSRSAGHGAAARGVTGHPAQRRSAGSTRTGAMSAAPRVTSGSATPPGQAASHASRSRSAATTSRGVASQAGPDAALTGAVAPASSRGSARPSAATSTAPGGSTAGEAATISSN